MLFLAEISRASGALGALALALVACSSATNAPLADGNAAGTGSHVNSAGGTGVVVSGAAGATTGGSSSVTAGGGGGSANGTAGAPASGGTTAVGGHGGATASAGQPGTAGASSNGRARFEPEDGKTILAIGQDSESIDEYTSSVGPQPAGVMMYTNIGDLAGVYSAANFGAGEDSLPHWATENAPFAIQLGLTLVNQLSNVTSGSLDGDIDRLADALKGTKRPVFLRVGYEFDSDWAGYDPNAFKPAYQRIVTRMRAKNADNVAFVWHAWGYYHSFNQASAMAWYPGDSYVDWVAVSFFPGWDDASEGSAGAARNELWQISVDQHKPFMIAESGPKAKYQPSLGQASWTGFYAGLFSFITTHNVKFLSYINANWEAQPLWAGQGWGDTRVQTNPYVLSQWKSTIADPRYLNSSTTLYGELGF